MTANRYVILFTIIFLSSTTAFQFRQCNGGDCPVIFPDPGLSPICYWAVDVVLDPTLSSTSSPLSVVQTTYNDSTMSISTQVHAESQLKLDSLPFESDLQVNISSPTCSVVEIDVSAKQKDSTVSSFRSIGNLTWAGLAELLPSTQAGIMCEAESADCQIDLDTSVLNGSPIKIETNSIVRSGNSFYMAYNHTLFKECGGWILVSNIKLTCGGGSSSSSGTTATSSESSPPKAYCRFFFGKECSGSSSSGTDSSDHSSSQSDSSSSSGSATAGDSYEMPPFPETTVFPLEPSPSADVVSPSSARSRVPVGGLFSGAPMQFTPVSVSVTPSPSKTIVAAPIFFASSSSGMSSWVSQLW